MTIDWRGVPIFVTNFNNLERGFRCLLTWLRAAGHENITVLDNASTWPPLLEFYDRSPELQVVRLTENKGPYVFWQMLLHTQQTGPFVVTDPDVVPSVACPYDLVARMLESMETLPHMPCKVGPSLRIDNLPDHYIHKQEVMEWERQYWRYPTADGSAYEALIDTTFALYKAGSTPWPKEGTHYRLAPPYTVEHVPWYEDSTKECPERTHYKACARKEFLHW